MIGEIPHFDVYSDMNEAAGGPIIINQKGFYKRLVDFIEFNLKSNFEIDILCYLVDPDGSVMEAKLEEDGYSKSLLKSIEYYKENEEYEICKRISNLIKEYEL
tara:strand:+ start:401 stop:709 length:309 start_codon:yes stop_codon:yes gene_type:complete